MTPNPESPASTPSPAPVLIAFLLVPLIGIIAALLLLSSAPAEDSANLPEALVPDTASLINYAAPEFTLSLLDGADISLASYQGRPLFLNFWQTTCEPCKRELPDFIAFSADQGATGVAVLAVAFDETSDMVQGFLTEQGLSGLTVALDPTSVTRREYGVQGIPVTFIIDAQGVVRYMHIGAMDRDQMEEYAEFIMLMS